jgi:hypothetical protein
VTSLVILRPVLNVIAPETVAVLVTPRLEAAVQAPDVTVSLFKVEINVSAGTSGM